MVYGAMNRRDWRTVGLDDVDFDPLELSSQLIPALHIDGPGDFRPAGYGDSLVEECRLSLSTLLPFNDAEREFLDLLLEEGRISPGLLTVDHVLQERISSQPLLHWKALNVRRYRGFVPKVPHCGIIRLSVAKREHLHIEFGTLSQVVPLGNCRRRPGLADGSVVLRC